MQQVINSTINKSIQLIKNSNFDEAELLLKKQLAKDSRNRQALNLLGQMFLHKQDYESAIEYFSRSINLNDQDYLIHYYLGLALQNLKKYAEALGYYLNSYKLKPDFKELYAPIGLTLAIDHNYYDAYLFYTMAFQHQPKNEDLANNLFHVCKKLGLHKEALRYCRKKYELNPNNRHALMGLIFNAHKDPDLKLEDFKKLAEEYYNKFLKREHLNKDFSKQMNATKTKLKIGFVTSDLFLHPVSTFLLAIIERMNKNDFEVFLYYSRDKYDEVTERFQALCPNFKSIFELDDKAAADLISKDEIDILFDLSGYTKGNRLDVFTQKPAPIQITYIGYFGTLAIPEMDYIFADDNLIKEDEFKYFTEKVYSLGKCFTHATLNNVNQVSTEPAYLRNGFVTFGSTNRFHKISEANIKTWSEILHQAPEAKFLFNCATFSRESNKTYVHKLFEKCGIKRERVIFKCTLPREEFLQSYADIDILLDPFPYGGGTTSLESLLNGVPVITIYGDRWVSRMTATKLIAIDCKELIAQDIEEYISLAVNLANDKERIKTYRETLNARIQNSDLNIDKYMERFSKAIKDIWQKECNKS